jgi:hypothetical protein
LGLLSFTKIILILVVVGTVFAFFIKLSNTFQVR